VERLGHLSAGELVDSARHAAPHLQEEDRFEVCLEPEGGSGRHPKLWNGAIS
jgi:hypothetical protein